MNSPVAQPMRAIGTRVPKSNWTNAMPMMRKPRPKASSTAKPLLPELKPSSPPKECTSCKNPTKKKPKKPALSAASPTTNCASSIPQSPKHDLVVGEIREYHEFIDCVRKWITKIDSNYACINALSGLQDGYLAKLIARSPIRNFGRTSLGPTLGALGLKLLLVIDTESLAKIRPRLIKRKKHASDDASDGNARSLRFNSKLAHVFAHRRALLQSPETRKQIARKAARVRWGR